MADGVKVTVQGLNQLVRTMRKAGVDLQDLKKANQAAGTIVATAGKSAVSRDTGSLAKSIRPAKVARKALVRAGGGRIRYARFQEFGSSKNAATHYLYGSADRTQPEWLAQYEWELAGVIARIKGQ